MAERIVELVRPIAKIPLLPGENSKKRVATYARVSTDSDEQMGSVKAQIPTTYARRTHNPWSVNESVPCTKKKSVANATDFFGKVEWFRCHQLNEIVRYSHDEIQTSLDEIFVFQPQMKLNPSLISRQSRISSRSDFICFS